VRAALASGAPGLAAWLVHGFEPRTPLSDRALQACRAQLAEFAGDPAEAAALYAESTERGREFGNLPECAYALLGHGRCLMTLGEADAEAPLHEARELFASMGYEPALAEAEALLARGEAAAV
jgi:hypothetical protein